MIYYEIRFGPIGGLLFVIWMIMNLLLIIIILERLRRRHKEDTERYWFAKSPSLSQFQAACAMPFYTADVCESRHEQQHEALDGKRTHKSRRCPAGVRLSLAGAPQSARLPQIDLADLRLEPPAATAVQLTQDAAGKRRCLCRRH